jgi:hypothetical protein
MTFLDVYKIITTFADVEKITIMTNDITDYEILGVDDSSLLIAAEPLWRGIADELQELHYLKGIKFVNQLNFIFVRKGIYRLYDLKTIQGKASVLNRLMESIGQTNHVLINVCTKYNPRLMATQIRNYFQINPKAFEVLVYKGKKAIVVTRRIAENPLFLIQFQRKFVK